MEDEPLLPGVPIRRTTAKKWAAAFGVACFACLALVIVTAVQRNEIRQLREARGTIQPQGQSGTTAMPQVAFRRDGSRRRVGRLTKENRAARIAVMAPYLEGHAYPMGEAPWEVLAPEDLPKEWDWRNVSGRNMLTQNSQQHLPNYCGGCWVFSSVQALSDRIHIARNASYPAITLAHQVMLNCQDCGDCEEGGDAMCVLGFARKHGIPDNTCQPYRAATGTECVPKHQKNFAHCKEECICNNAESDRKTKYAIKEYRKWYVKHYGRIPTMNTHAMKAEILANGPIICGMECTDNFEYNYAGGVYAEKTEWSVEDYDHDVAVSGWGVDEKTGEEYWLIRNTWGTFWGEDGWFKLKMGADNMGVEGGCMYATIDLERSAPVDPIPISRYWHPPSVKPAWAR
eukprot:tig00021721_g23209.t1